ncbi:DgyrCDS4128 [Dimorphilus gyrociliatus]|uniref:DgyrCDS4128 n=1 Tax=Dimorphilus gyrociliatus TaxID=2664684 RepID=A0A7I8VKL8_9ANNE|nr:DgyrCDS4128 [Dimorphilus gyrociliatus]
MRKIATILLPLFAYTLANDCIGKPDGTHVHQACNYYVECRNQQEVPVYCNPPSVYNHVKRKCDNPQNTPPPCGAEEKCDGLPNGRYPLLNLQCQCYFTCQGGTNIGTQCCPNNLVWDVFTDVCNWPNLTPPPCGTKPPEIPLPTTAAPLPTTNTPKPATTQGAIPQTTSQFGCPPTNFCQSNQICCWHKPTISGCCNSGFKCCPSIRGDDHDCCPVNEVVYALANDCIGKPDGTHIHQACNYYVECRNQQEVPVFCNPPSVYNHMKRTCDNPQNTPPPCGNEEKCDDLPNGRYPLLNLQCQCYFTCQGGTNIGTQCCPNSLVWDVFTDVCNWPNLTPPPCGSKPPEATPTPSLKANPE